MPAILPARLKQQAALLAGQYDDPPAYVRSLHHLMEFYSERAIKPGAAMESHSLLPSYHVRQPVLRQVLFELSPYVEEDSQTCLALLDRLWEEPYLEFRLLAIGVLGQLPVEETDQLLERLEAWLRTNPEERILTAMLTQGLSRLRREKPAELDRLIEKWLLSPDLLEKQLGLRALIPVLQDPAFQNLPVYYRLVMPLVRQSPGVLRPDILDVIDSLARCSPQETAFFLRQALMMANSPDAAWFIRQSARSFPPGIQEELRRSVRGMGA